MGIYTYISHAISTGYLVQGSNGEYAYLTDEERIDQVKQVVKMAAPDKLVIAGSGSECKLNYHWYTVIVWKAKTWSVLLLNIALFLSPSSRLK